MTTFPDLPDAEKIEAMRARAKIEADQYGQATVPAMLLQGAAWGEAMRECERLRQRRTDLDARIRFALQFMVDSITKDKSEVALNYPLLFATIQKRRAELGNLGGIQFFGEIARDILALMDRTTAGAATQTEYERKIDQMKEDFPNGI